MSDEKTVTGEQAHDEAMAEYRRQREAGELKPCCFECRWYERRGDGECRRNAPVASMVEMEEGAPVWPRVSGSHWCGQFEWRG